MNCDKCEDTGLVRDEHFLAYWYCTCIEGQRLKELHEGQREQVIDAKRRGEDNRYDPRMEEEKP